VGPEDRARSFVAVAAQHKETLERLRSLRADLAGGRWWPLPERRAVMDEIGQLAASLELLDVQLADPDGARATALVLIADAVDEAARAGHAADTMVGAVIGLLTVPGRTLRSDVVPLSLRDLPGVAEHLTAEAVRRQVSVAAAG
jgi:hypothetical protein